MSDRVRIYACVARAGLPPRSYRADHIHERFHSAAFHARLAVVLTAWSAWTWTHGAAKRSWGLVVSILGEALFD